MSTSLRIACIQVPRSPTAAPAAAEAVLLAGALLTAAPRVTQESFQFPIPSFQYVPTGNWQLATGNLLFWADASGMERRGGDAATAQALLAAAREATFEEARVGIAGTCIAAAAATQGRGSPWRVVPPGRDGLFLSRRPLEVLPMADELRETLRLLGLRTCGELARFAAADIELRFGAEGVEVRRLARGEDARWPFRPPPLERASAEAEFEPPVAGLEPLRFVLRGLIASVLAQSARRQRVPAALRLLLRLEGREESAVEEACEIRPARPTADERVLADLCRLALEGIGELPAPIVGVSLEEIEIGAARADQLDIFRPPVPDPAALQAVLAPLLARWGEGALARAVWRGAHLPSAQAVWEELPREEGEKRKTQDARRKTQADEWREGVSGEISLCLRRFSEPLALAVITDAQGRPLGVGPSPPSPLSRERERGNCSVPEPRSCFPSGNVVLPSLSIGGGDGGGGAEEPGEGQLFPLPSSLFPAVEGPEHLSGQWWGGAYAREYWLAEDEEGRLWLLFREGRTGEWWGEGWWD